jgi:lipopolysaccharide export LptBFGC system permease protein LptF
VCDRASGISLLSLISPILLLSLALCGVSALVNLEIAPRCRVAYKSLIEGIRVEFSNLQFPEGRFIKDFPGHIFYVGKNRRGNLEDITVYRFEPTNGMTTYRAPRGKVETDTVNKKLILHLYEGKSLTLTDSQAMPGVADVTLEFDLSPAAMNKRPKISEMTFSQLWDELHDLERRIQTPISLRNLSAEELRARKSEWKKQRKDLTSPVRLQLHQQVAFSFACFGFTLVGFRWGYDASAGNEDRRGTGSILSRLITASYPWAPLETRWNLRHT